MKQKIRLGDCYALTIHKRKQYTIRYISLLAVLTTMCLYAVKQASAQQAEPAATAVPDIKPLQIGDTIPGWLWHHPLQVVNHPENKNTVTLNDYRGKLIILDFWGTTCGSCIKAMPNNHELSLRFSEDLVILPVTNEAAAKTFGFIHKNPITSKLNLSSVVNDIVLAQAFPFFTVPHYAWISKTGKILATTSSNDVNEGNIQLAIAGKPPVFDLKTTVDINEPLFFATKDLPANADIMNHAVFIRGFMPSLPEGGQRRVTHGVLHGMCISNVSLERMYRMIVARLSPPGFQHNGKLFFTLDSIESDEFYTIDYNLPLAKADSVYPRMLEILNQYSGYTGKWISKELECIVLTALGNKETFIGTKGDMTMASLINRLNRADIAGDSLVINVTGYKGPVNFHLQPPYNFISVIEQLEKVGLTLKKEKHIVQVFELKEDEQVNNQQP